MTRTIWQKHGLFLGLLLVALFKLWVVHTEEIYGSSTEYDALWYVGSAKHWYWGANYSWTAFVRPCAYPLFIAVVHFLGIPLRIAIELVQMAGFAVLIAALRKAAVPRLLCLAIFALMVLHPATLLFNNHSMSDSFYTAILPLALGASLLTLLTKKFVNAIASGVAYAVLWNTREESFLIPLMVAVVFFLALGQRRSAGSGRAHLIFWVKRTGAIVGALLILVAAVYSANYRVFHSFAKSDLSSPSFEKVFKALLRVDTSYSVRYIAVNQEALRRAFEVSPAFAWLKPQFETPIGRAWTNPVFETLQIREYGPWFMWALRNLTANAGLYKDPVSTNSFFRKAAREINKACDEGRIPSRFVISSFLDPGAVARLNYLPSGVWEISRLFLFRHQKVMVRGDTNLVPWMTELYSEMTFRQPQAQPAFYPDTNPVVVPDTFSARAAVATQNFIGANYVYLFIALAWAGLAAFLCLLGFFRRWRMSDGIITALVLIGATILMRIVFFGFLQATWWMNGYDRYVFPVMPLASGFFVLLIYAAVIAWRRPSEAPESV